VRARIVVALILAAACVALAGERPALEVTVPEAAVSVGDRVHVRVMARGGEDLMWGELEVGEGAEESWPCPHSTSSSAIPMARRARFRHPTGLW